jgi:hypothetical protein
VIRLAVPLFLSTSIAIYDGQYYIPFDPMNWNDFMINFSCKTIPCGDGHHDGGFCEPMCTGEKLSRSVDNYPFRFNEEIVFPLIGIYVYFIVCFVVEIPITWFLIMTLSGLMSL